MSLENEFGERFWRIILDIRYKYTVQNVFCGHYLLRRMPSLEKIDFGGGLWRISTLGNDFGQ